MWRNKKKKKKKNERQNSHLLKMFKCVSQSRLKGTRGEPGGDVAPGLR